MPDFYYGVISRIGTGEVPGAERVVDDIVAAAGNVQHVHTWIAAGQDVVDEYLQERDNGDARCAAVVGADVLAMGIGGAASTKAEGGSLRWFARPPPSARKAHSAA